MYCMVTVFLECWTENSHGILTIVEDLAKVLLMAVLAYGPASGLDIHLLVYVKVSIFINLENVMKMIECWFTAAIAVKFGCASLRG